MLTLWGFLWFTLTTKVLKKYKSKNKSLNQTTETQTYFINSGRFWCQLLSDLSSTRRESVREPICSERRSNSRGAIYIKVYESGLAPGANARVRVCVCLRVFEWFQYDHNNVNRNSGDLENRPTTTTFIQESVCARVSLLYHHCVCMCVCVCVCMQGECIRSEWAHVSEAKVRIMEISEAGIPQRLLPTIIHS